MLDLLIIMLERVGTIVAVAFILTRFRFFKQLIHQDTLTRRQKVNAILFFGAFGVIGTYLGVAFSTQTLHFNSVSMNLSGDEAIANSRVIGIVVAGLLGGWRLGLGAGLIAGLHRMTLGGFTAFSCGLSTILSGLLASWFYRKGKTVHPVMAFAIGALAEAMQMGLILILSKPFTEAWSLVQAIGLPMILANGLGTAIFLLIVYNVLSDQDKATALQAQKTLRIANQTLAHLRQGMTAATCDAVCRILYRELEPSAVAMTNQSEILAHVGVASDHHQPHSPIQTTITKEVLQHGRRVTADDGAIHCIEAHCPLGAAVIAPLKQRDEVVGTLKLYYPSEKAITDVTIELIDGLSSLLSDQLEIAAAGRAHELAKDAEIKALQAQISPHFFFNSLNVIISLIRTDPDQARQLLMSLSKFLRQNVEGTTAMRVTLEQELAHVQAYLQIEQARFVDKLTVELDVDPSVLSQLIPPLTLQPIVENAVKHGIADMASGSVVTVSIGLEEGETVITVRDNGKGIAEERLPLLGEEPVESATGTGMGLYNVHRRLVMSFGSEAGLRFGVPEGEGTVVRFRIPQTVKEEVHV
ncbi:sensor histidine kinase [Sporosarcina trichiuri]|uniref:sensor histidine kinase n=1 Tax=Sporosarcina trichiuri TaxID=3056445 RepID=UPI0025B5B1B2|nr:sensor histidine kinase [Sporosarcina sp. 0.2-SM1T-5]WJY27080.1 sensor histidine kinase [Sporosarcina sp. 0.2-SM1T-5]